jgi:tRNA (cmo5U34)-methyltransferase
VPLAVGHGQDQCKSSHPFGAGRDAPLENTWHNVTQQFHVDPDTYLERIRAALPGYDDLQDQAIQAIPFEPREVLELGIGSGETTRRLLARFPNARVTGVDVSPKMASRARELGVEVRVARIEDPIPEGAWDLVIGVLSVHHLTSEQKRALFLAIRERSRSLVLGDQVSAEHHALPPEPGIDFVEDPADLAAWCDGEIVWRRDDLAVITAVYG